jgi:putative flippase GtrA
MTIVSRFQHFTWAITAVVRRRLAFLKKAGSFAAIGVVNNTIDFSVFLVAYKLLAFSLVPANLLSWMVSISGSYVLNSVFTFAAETGGKLTLRAYGTFVLSGIAGLIGNTATLWVTSYFAPVLVAKVLAIGMSFLVNFSLAHFMVFRDKNQT